MLIHLILFAYMNLTFLFSPQFSVKYCASMESYCFYEELRFFL